MTFLSDAALERIGFGTLGSEVSVSDRASIYNPACIALGDHTRIDDFSILSAGPEGIEIGRFVHVACHCSIQGAGRIVLDDFAGLSSHSAIYSSTDDFSGGSMTGPTVDDRYRNVNTAAVIIGRHVIIGAGTVILPGVTIATGAAVGAQSLVVEDCEEFWLYGGIPARKLKQRRRDLLRLEQEFLRSP